MSYYTREGEATRNEIETAFSEGRAVLVHGYDVISGGISTSLSLEGRHWDTRDTSYSMSESSWTRKPGTLKECLDAAFGH